MFWNQTQKKTLIHEVIGVNGKMVVLYGEFKYILFDFEISFYINDICVNREI